jgi:hypothetical protein
MAHTNDNCGAWVIELLEVGPESQGEIGWEIGRGDMKPASRPAKHAHHSG